MYLYTNLKLSYSRAMRMIRTNRRITLTARNIVRAPQRRGESFEGTFGFAGASLLTGSACFCPDTAISTPSVAGGPPLPLSDDEPIKGLISEGAVLARSEFRGRKEKITNFIYLHHTYSLPPSLPSISSFPPSFFLSQANLHH